MPQDWKTVTSAVKLHFCVVVEPEWGKHECTDTVGLTCCEIFVLFMLGEMNFYKKPTLCFILYICISSFLLKLKYFTLLVRSNPWQVWKCFDLHSYYTLHFFFSFKITPAIVFQLCLTSTKDWAGAAFCISNVSHEHVWNSDLEAADHFLCRETTWVILIFNYLKSDYGKRLLIPCVFGVHGHPLMKASMEFEGVFATCAPGGGSKALQISLCQQKWALMRLGEKVGLDLELASLGRVVLKSGEQGWAAGAEDVCSVTKGCTSDIRMILGNAWNKQSLWKTLVLLRGFGWQWTCPGCAKLMWWGCEQGGSMRSQQIAVPRRCHRSSAVGQQQARGGFGDHHPGISALNLSPSWTCCFLDYNQTMPILLNFPSSRISPKTPKVWHPQSPCWPCLAPLWMWNPQCVLALPRQGRAQLSLAGASPQPLLVATFRGFWDGSCHAALGTVRHILLLTLHLEHHAGLATELLGSVPVQSFEDFLEFSILPLLYFPFFFLIYFSFSFPFHAEISRAPCSALAGSLQWVNGAGSRWIVTIWVASINWQSSLFGCK